MVGEIRDRETAEISFKAASTGHLVVSTLHTNDSVSTVTRLVDIGIPAYMVSEVLSIVIAQRLVRKVCTSCAQPHTVEDDVLLDLGVAKEDLPNFKNLKKGTGCRKCNNSGYKGRMPIFEILQMTPALRKAIIQEKTNAEMKAIAIKNGLVTLRASALKRLRDGFTTVEEVVNTSISDEGMDE
jgi:type IV pilus assembly protein PilB